MSSRIERLRVGSYRLVRQLQGGGPAERWLAFNEADETAHVAYRFRLSGDKVEQRRFVSAVESLSRLSHPHILPIEQFSLGTGGGGWVVSPYTGSHDGLVTLASLVRDKGGRLDPVEAERGLMQILEAVEAAHEQGHQHGSLAAEEILIDRRGSVSIELYGFRRKLEGNDAGPATETIRDELRSIAGLGYWMATGLSPEEPRIRAGRLIQKLDEYWDAWLDEGLDPFGGFASAGEALAGLPGMRREVEGRTRPSPVRTVLGRFTRALRPAKL